MPQIGQTPEGPRVLDHRNLSEICRAAAIEAGARILEVQGRPDFDVRAKADQSPVTEADEAADALIHARLSAAFPDTLIVTEERAASHVQRAGRALIVDPLDGTKEFVRRQGDFTVNIALIEDGVPVFGVVLAPARGRLFMTAPDGGAIEETGALDPGRPGARRPLAPARPDNAALRVVASKSHRDAATDDYIRRYEVAEAVSAGSSLKFCLLAAGEADLYPRLGPTMEWDTAAGDAVLRAAGGETLRMDDHAPLRYAKPGYENPFFVARVPGVALAG